MKLLYVIAVGLYTSLYTIICEVILKFKNGEHSLELLLTLFLIHVSVFIFSLIFGLFTTTSNFHQYTLFHLIQKIRTFSIKSLPFFILPAFIILFSLFYEKTPNEFQAGIVFALTISLLGKIVPKIPQNPESTSK